MMSERKSNKRGRKHNNRGVTAGEKESKRSRTISSKASRSSITGQVVINEENSPENSDSGSNTEMSDFDSPDRSTRDMAKDDERFIELLKKNFGDILSTDQAQDALKKAADGAIKALDERMTKVEERSLKIEGTVHKVRIQTSKVQDTVTKLTEEVDTLKQDRRNKTVRIQGLVKEEGKDVKDKVIELAKKMGLEIDRNNFDAFSTKKEDFKLVIVKFDNEAEKKRFYKARIKLRGIEETKHFFINEDLIPARAEVAAEARKMVKEKRATKTWTMDGQIFIKIEDSDKPTKIANLSQLMGLKDNRLATHTNKEQIEGDDGVNWWSP